MILMDIYEPAVIQKLIEEEGEEVTRIPLPHGDYQFYGHEGLCILVERKAIGDLLKSLGEGRLQKQLRDMLTQENTETVLLVEGYWSATDDHRIRYKGGISKWNLSSVMNFLLSVQLEGVRLMFSPHQYGTAHLLVKMHQFFEKPEHKALAARPKPLFCSDGLREQQLYFLMGLPGIGEELAHRILDHFGSPAEVLYAVHRLPEVEGIGRKTLARIEKVLGLT